MAEKDNNGVVPDEAPRAAGATDGGVVTEKPTVTEADSKTNGTQTTLPSSANGNAVQTSQPQTVNEKVEPGSLQGAASTTEAKTADSTLKADASVKDAHGRAGSKTSTAPSARKPTGANGQRKKPKKSLLSAIFSIIPCIHSSSAYPPELDLPPPRDSASTEDAAKANEKALKTGTPPRGVGASKTTTVNDKEREKPTDTPDRTVTPTAKVDDATAVALPPSPSPITPSRSQQPTPDPALVVPTPTTSHLLPKDETAGLTSGAVQPPGSSGHEDEEPTIVHVPVHHDDEAESVHQGDATGHDADVDHELASDDDEERLIIQGGIGIPIVDGQPKPLLPPVSAAHQGRKCLVLDLDETLLHSSFKLIPQCDYVVPVEIEWQWHNVYVIKRPGVDQFLKKMGELYEIVVFTASLSKYADPVLDKLDVHKVVTHRLFRESCYNHKGNYVKDLSQLGRPLNETIILDNSPASYIFHPNNAVPVSSWFNDPHDTELTDLCPFLTDLRLVDDIRGVLDGGL